MDPQKKYFIGDMSKICNLSKKTLRYYDEIDLIPSRRFGENNYRYYTEQSLLTVPVVKYYKQMGFTLEEMKAFIKGEDQRAFTQIKQSFLEKISSFEVEQEKIYRKHTAVKDWYDLLVEAESVIESNINSVSVKFMDKQDLLYRDQTYNGDIQSSIINVDFTNYVENINNEITGAVILNFSSHKTRCLNKQQPMKILQKVIRPCSDDFKEQIGGYAVLSCYHIGCHSSIPETYKKMYAWANENGYDLAQESYERYVVDYWTTQDSTKFVTEIFIVTKRGMKVG